jgi:photoactive yellow protein
MALPNDSSAPTNAGERAALIDRVSSMTREEVDLLPVGVMLLDLDGTIREYNTTEATMAHRAAADQIGKNFFRDVAPCTGTPEFEGRFRALAEPGASGKADFEYVFTFPWALEKVLITFLRAQGADGIYVLVTWTLDITRPPAESTPAP